MKLSLFSITAIVASFVAANPILAPRAPSSPFRLWGDVGVRDMPRSLLGMIPVAEPNHQGYFQFGWYGKRSEKIELFFGNGPSTLGPVFDVRQNGYEMYVPRSALPPRIIPLTFLQGPTIDRGAGSWHFIL